MIRISNFLFASMLLPSLLFAQELTYERMSVYAYEDMSDWLRRFPGMYPMDYGVAGVPVLFRPWGLNPWYVGVERDGIPWNRVNDGLYDSNLDSPEGMESVAFSTNSLDPLGTIRFITRSLPTDSATTEVRLREGYYGFGRVDFAHAQKISDRVSAEGRGRLFWYDGLRASGSQTYSKARFYSLSGKLNFAINERWQSKLEYGGSNVDAQSPTPAFLDSVATRPQIYSEREYGTARLEMRADQVEFDFGLHARQDRETRESEGTKLFGLRERFWYGFAEGRVASDKGAISGRVAGESAEFSFPGSAERNENALALIGTLSYDLDFVKVDGRILYRTRIGDNTERETDLNDEALSATVESFRLAGFALKGEGAYGQKAVPQFWRYAEFSAQNRPLLVSDEFASNSYYGGKWEGFEADQNFMSELDTWAAGVNWQRGSGGAALKWRGVYGGNVWFLTENDSTYLYSSSKEDEWFGPEFTCDIPLTNYVRMQSWSSLQCDKNGMSRALDTRSFSRLIYSQDFFKAPLHVESYVAYELIGRHRAESDYGSKVLGPAHLIHFRIEGTIEGVTLIWGTENLTGQHYEYLPGYMLIRKEEYFGLKWTLKL